MTFDMLACIASEFEQCLRSCIVKIAIALLALFTCLPCSADAFDWRDVDGKNYVTPARDQMPAGTCWAFGAIAAVESRWLIQNDLPGGDIDLSEQNLICGGAGALYGGHLRSAFQYIWDVGVVSEDELPYTASATSPYWPLDSGWEDRVWKLEESDPDTLGNLAPFTALMLGNIGVGIEDYWGRNAMIRASLRQYGPLTCIVFSGNMSGYYTPPPDGWGPTKAGASPNHIVTIVGYQDMPDASGGYWIIKNSWGGGWGDGGFGYMRYGDIEKYVSVYAITGDMVRIPEPPTLFLLISGGFLLRIRPLNTHIIRNLCSGHSLRSGR